MHPDLRRGIYFNLHRNLRSDLFRDGIQSGGRTWNWAVAARKRQAEQRILSNSLERFDRKGQHDKVAVEDFSQLAGLGRETKYNYSMEKVVKIIDTYCTFPAIEKAELLKRVLFNFLVGNEDMHLKNYSVFWQKALWLNG